VHGADLTALRLLVDRAEIHDLVNRYATGVDRRDLDQVASCFAPDVRVVGWGGRDFADRDELIDFIRGVAVFDMTMHMMGNQRIVVDGDDALVDTRAMLAHRLLRTGEPPYELNVPDARYVERLRRTEGAWVIVQRGGEPPADGAAAIGACRPSDAALRWLLDRALDDEAAGLDHTFRGLRASAGAPPPAATEPGVQRLVDRAAIQDAVVAATPPEPAALLNNHVATVDGDVARAETYAYVGEPWHEGATVLVDHLERTGDGWQVIDRQVTDTWRRPR
jgi:hypothetical protein